MESISEEADQGDQNFISILLGEMKNQFMSESKMIENEKEELEVEQDVDKEQLSTEEISVVPVPQEFNEDAILTSQPNDENLINNIKTEISTNDETSEITLNNCEENIDLNKDSQNNIQFKKPHDEDKKENAPGRRSLRCKSNSIDEVNNTVKRSSRRRSKECNESVLQSAIARKEKSYNESAKPQRLTRQLKPTQKILENLAIAKYEKGKSEKSKSSEKNNVDNEETFSKRKKKMSKKSEHVPKKIKLSSCENSFDSDVSDIDSNGNSELIRRSQRLSSSRYKEEMELDTSDEVNVADLAYNVANEPECSSVGAELIASKLCLCTTKTQLYPAEIENDAIFCAAVDSIEEKLLGCNRLVDEKTPLIRPSKRVPYALLCDLHKNRMLRHNCCPNCGIFCTQGKFVECEAGHQYHRECQITVGNLECCPHCGITTPPQEILITMETTGKPVFFNKQKMQHSSAKMSFNNGLTSNELNSKSSSPPLIEQEVFKPIEISEDEEQIYDINDLYECIKTQDLEKLSIILASKSVDTSYRISEFSEGTVLHYASQKGYAAVVHMLVVSGMDLDLLDREQNTPLMLAITSHQNEIAKYFIKAGASIMLKGTDGMTPLHLSAKCGNLKACEMIIQAGSEIRNFVNIQDDGGWTPLVWACEHGYLDVASFLILKGADPKLCDVEHNIALHWAAFSGSSSIVELLLNHGTDVNAVNAHGDSPLHIAARENMYNSVVVLLARGASVSLINKNNESPMDCVPEGGDCYDVIALNIQLQTLTESDFKRNKYILSQDISKGKESNPIQCINMIDDDPKPADFVYITKNCFTSDNVKIDTRISTLNSCVCEERCVSDECDCARLSTKSSYDEQGKLKENFDYADSPMIFECNEACNCNYITCTNRVVQKGLTQRFQLFKMNTKGWGIKTLCFIPKGSFVCEYIGEILDDGEADRREDDSFLFDLDNRDSESYCIDAKYFGNVARFINHSCSPNLTPVKVFIDHQDLKFPRIALFANRDILIDEEISFDYGEKFWLVKCKSFTCQCGFSECKYSQEKIHETIELYNKRLLSECKYLLE